MIVSRLLPLFRGGVQNTRLFSTSKASLGGHGNWVYRVEGNAPRINHNVATFASAFMWWWVFWHVFTDYGHLIGEVDWQDPLKWTDEELGIPPDDEDDPEFLAGYRDPKLPICDSQPENNKSWLNLLK